ncbi:MAG TPA: D-arabinono-1,4-lactone oxidase [Thermoanaerobaculia bacterium]
MAWRFLGRPGRPWRNWSRNLKAHPERVFYPKSLDDLVAIVHLARVERKKIRVAGDSHTWSPLVPTDDYLVFTKHLKGIRVDLSKPERPRVTVAPGTTIAEFNDACRENGLVLPTNVVPTEFHLIAVASTGCHGTGILEPTISDFVEAAEIIDSAGNLRRFTEQEHGPEVMNAVRLNLGLFGIVWRMTFRVVPAFNVRERDDLRVDMESAIPHFREWVTGHEYTELVWWPFNRKMWVKHYDRTSAAPTITPGRHRRDEFIQRVKLRLGRLTYALMTAVPPLSPPLMRLMYRVSGGNVDAVIPLQWAIHYQAGLKIVRATNAEVAFPIDDDFANVIEAWRVVAAKTREYQARGSHPFNMALVARFVRGTPIPHSPAYGQGLFCFIEIMSFADTADWVPFSTEVMAAWLRIGKARPHWAKAARQFPVSLMRDVYGEDLRRFLEIRDRLGVDPGNMFVNDYLEGVLYGRPG